MSDTEDMLEQLSKLNSYIDRVTSKSHSHDCVSNYLPSAALQNTKIEIKDLKLQYLTLPSYLIFLNHFIDKDPFASLSSDVTQCDEVIYDCAKAEEDEKETLFKDLLKLDDISTKYSALEKVAEEFQTLKKNCTSLAKTVKSIAASFDNNCSCEADARLLLQNQEEEKLKLNNDLDSLLVLPQELNVPDNFLSFNKLSINEELSDCDDSSSLAMEINDTCCVNVVSSGLDYDVLEMFYINSSRISSSVEIKVEYEPPRLNKSRGPIKCVIVRNSPVNVDDLLKEAAIQNNFAFILPFLQQRLEEN